MWILVMLIIRFVSWTLDFSATGHEEETVRSWSDSVMVVVGTVSEQGK
jgi:hypothetical protein